MHAASFHGHPLEPSLPDGVRDRIASRPHRLIALDYDGTLAPFHPGRMRARLAPETAAALTLACARPDTTVAVVSGRPLEELRTLLADFALGLVGEHGWEQGSPGGRTVRRVPEPIVAGRLAHAAESVPQLAPLLERKRCSVVLHTRGLPAIEAARTEAVADARWRPLELPGQLRLVRVHGGLELLASSRDKGVALRELLQACSPDTLPVAIGDDATDEPMFRAVAGDGIGIRVGDPAARTAARWRLGSVAEVTEFLVAYGRLARRS